ncbi:hypothetical protein K505DRAFT_365224 [Melanomma pulvis-pyrius CBS 109.77]|uniref:Uncharacterized protein n=1 Tax=Melanomma pulvis-pyrius CBS 109.77 TaxID=1314802 RepID=A0A6A6X132_9PLEO|nr:hypothetical protein K505DRAFT_365224 [Melanomma pulvis-pyrius CBS 109.77]
MEFLKRVFGRSERSLDQHPISTARGPSKPHSTCLAFALPLALARKLGFMCSSLGKQSPPPHTQTNFLSLPPEIHLIIADFLPPSSRLIIAATPNHRLHAIYHLSENPRNPWPTISPTELTLARELLTRDIWHAQGRDIITKLIFYRFCKLTPGEESILQGTVFLCRACQAQVDYRHFPLLEVWPRLRDPGKANVGNRRCWGKVKPLKIPNGTNIFWCHLETWRDYCLAVDKLKWVNAFSTVDATIPTGNTIGTGNVHTDIMIRPSRTSTTTFRTLNPSRRTPPTSKYRPPRNLSLSSTSEPVFLGKSYKAPTMTATTRYYWMLKYPTPLPAFPIPTSYVALRRALLHKRPHFCPHLSWRNLLRTDADSVSERSCLLKHMTDCVNAVEMPWEDRVLSRRGEIMQKVKGLGMDCMVRGCRTEVRLEKARSLVMKGGASEDTGVGSTTANGGANGNAHPWVGDVNFEWTEMVWVSVKRQWDVDKPGSREWMVQVGLRGEGKWTGTET